MKMKMICIAAVSMTALKFTNAAESLIELDGGSDEFDELLAQTTYSNENVETTQMPVIGIVA